MNTPTAAQDSPSVSLQYRVDTAIRQHPHLRGSHIEPLADGNSVVLRGTVGSYFIKQMAQEAILCLEEASEVHNQLQVTWQNAAAAE